MQLGIPVDDLVGIGPSASSASVATLARNDSTQPISFTRRPVPGGRFGGSSATSSSSTDADEPFPASMTAPSSHMTAATSPQFSPYSYEAPPVPHNTAFSVGSSIAGRIQQATGLPLTYPRAPPPSLSTSLATSGFASPESGTSPISSRRPSFRVAERGSLARPSRAVEEEAIEE